MRVDKWIWAVRMTKTRTLTTKMCVSGKVLVNEEKIKASKIVKIGDTVAVHKKTVLIYEVIDFTQKRVGAEKAKEFYKNRTLVVPKADKNLREFAQGRREKGEGRPTKKDRRTLEKIKDY